MRIEVLLLCFFASANAKNGSIAIADITAVKNTTNVTAAVQAASSASVAKPLAQKPADANRALRRVLAAQPSTRSAKSLAADAKVEAARKHAAEVHAQVAQTQAVANAQMKEVLAKETAIAAVAGAKAAKVGDQKVLKVEKSIQDIQAEIKEKEKHLKVQTGLADEKQKDDAALKKDNVQIKLSTDNLRKEAEVAEELAKEKSDALAKAEKEETAAELKEKNLNAEARETQKFLRQTQAEEKTLQAKLVSLHKELTVDKPKTKVQQVASSNSTAAHEKKVTPAALLAPVNASTPTVAAVITSNQANSEKDTGLDADAVRKLLEENKRLKHEKEVLEAQLRDKKVSSEKAKLKQKLKARLLDIDRHVVMKKKMAKKK